MPELHRLRICERGLPGIAGQILGAMTFPEPDRAKERQRLGEAATIWLLRSRALRDPAWANAPQILTPADWFEPLDKIDRALKPLARAFRNRVTAGRMAAPFLMAAEAGEIPVLPKGMKSLSLNAAAEHVYPDSGFKDADNLETRAWRPSRPVIHLCVAYVVTVQERLREASISESPDLAELFDDRAFVATLLNRAEAMEPIVARSKLNIAADQLLRLRVH